MLLLNTDLDPLNKETHPQTIDGFSVLNKQIRFTPLLSAEDQTTTSKIVLIVDSGKIGYNQDNENISLLVNIYCPYKEWLITGDTLRPFAIMSRVRQDLQDKRINGLGEIKYLGFSISALTKEMASYTLRFAINAFS